MEKIVSLLYICILFSLGVLLGARGGMFNGTYLYSRQYIAINSKCNIEIILSSNTAYVLLFYLISAKVQSRRFKEMISHTLIKM
jgi:hypothetical protein